MFGGVDMTFQLKRWAQRINDGEEPQFNPANAMTNKSDHIFNDGARWNDDGKEPKIQTC